VEIFSKPVGFELYYLKTYRLTFFYLFFVAGCFLFILLRCFFGIGNQTPQATAEMIIVAIAEIIVFEERRGCVAAIELPP
jgi:hypothetical protein